MGKRQNETHKTYERHAEEFETTYLNHFRQFVRPEADYFLKNIKGKTIVDLGSGPGTHAHYFSLRGLDVLCVDYSPEMLKRCAVKGVKSLLVNIENFTMPPKTVDGVWMYHSLVHMKDDDIPKVVNNIARMLKPNGLLGLGVRKGSKNGYEKVWHGVKHWFNYFTPEKIDALFSKKFDVIRLNEKEIVPKKVFMNYIMRRK